MEEIKALRQNTAVTVIGDKDEEDEETKAPDRTRSKTQVIQRNKEEFASVRDYE